MAEPAHSTTTAEIQVDSHGHEKAGPIDVKPSLIALTYVTFALTALVLYKVAWKPILALLDQRENTLRKAVDDAEQLRGELAALETRRSAVLMEAEKQSRELIEQGRQAATNAAQVIEAKAREEAQILLENARREIRAEADTAVLALRRESADLAIGISRKILKDQLDETRSREIADALIGQL